MSRWKRFAFRINDQEQGMLKTIASNLHRTQSDTVRFLIFRAMDEIVTAQTKSQGLSKNLIRKGPRYLSKEVEGE